MALTAGQTAEQSKPKPQRVVAEAVPNRLLRLRLVLEATGLSSSTLYRMMDSGKFPRSIPIGGKTVAWRAKDVDRWCEEQYEAAQAS